MEREKSMVVSNKIHKGDKYFPEEWINKIYNSAEDVMEKTYLMYHIETGLRVSDVVGTEIVHIDWQNCRTYTYDCKKDEWRFIYWPERVKAQLKQWMKVRQIKGIKDKLLFPLCQKTANRILKRLAVKLGHPYGSRVSSHWLRHTFIRRSRKVGRDIKAVQQNTGDSINTLLNWYSDLSPEDMREEIEKR